MNSIGDGSLQANDDGHPWKPSAELAELLLAPACLTNALGIVVYLNRAWRNLAGIDTPHPDARPLHELIHPANRDDFAVGPATPAHAGIECLLLSADGAGRWFLLHAHPLPVAADGLDFCLWIGTDIHQRMQRTLVQEKLASLQTTMLDVTLDRIELVSPDGSLRHANKAGCQALGLPVDSKFGMQWLSLLPEDRRTVAWEAFEVAASGAIGRFSDERRDGEGNPRSWDSTLVPIPGADGALDAIACVSRDLTVERNALESRDETRAQLEIAARVGGFGVWDYDIVRDRLHCDYAWYRIMGLDPAQVVSTIGEFSPIIHPEDRERATEVTQTAADLISIKRDYAIVFRIIRPSGEIRWVRSAAFLQHDNGAPVRATGFVMDITPAWQGTHATATDGPRAA